MQCVLETFFDRIYEEKQKCQGRFRFYENYVGSTEEDGI
jgi:hypothetical protein